MPTQAKGAQQPLWLPLQHAPLVEIPDPSVPDADPFGFGTCKVVDDVYEKVKQIGEGTYGQVYLARHKESSERVALKKVRLDNEKGEGFPVTAIREIMILKDINHENIINLKEIVRSDVKKSNQFKGSIYMVLDYMEHDLTGLMERQKHFKPAQVKLLMHQLLLGLNHCHQLGILHRDLKGSNLLIDNTWRLKLTDFGLARNCKEALHLTNRTITLWYRPPELLLGAEQYRQEVDMWSVGCIFAELLTGLALFPGKNETDQLERIFAKLGMPDEENWPGVEKLPFFKILSKTKAAKLSLAEEFTRHNIHPTATALLCRLLTLNPRARLTASEALASDYFHSDPPMAHPSDLPKFEDSHEWEMKQRIKRRRDVANTGLAAPTSPGHNAPSAPKLSASSHSSDRDPKRHRPEQLQPSQPSGHRPAGPTGAATAGPSRQAAGHHPAPPPSMAPMPRPGPPLAQASNHPGLLPMAPPPGGYSGPPPQASHGMPPPRYAPPPMGQPQPAGGPPGPHAIHGSSSSGVGPAPPPLWPPSLPEQHPAPPTAGWPPPQQQQQDRWGQH
mmetsp:Transcript_36425/g.102888  ORF Transcript_36425/g.102888 Transcript_36425/m.102888 type:complete len:559 (+) Transcript_36425:300-1976(+)